MGMPTQDFIAYLKSLNISGIYAGEAWNPTTDSQILVIEEASPPTDDNQMYEQIVVAVYVRGDRDESSEIAYTKAREICTAILSNSDDICVNDTAYARFIPLNKPYGLGKDDNDRFVYVARYYSFRNAI